MGSIFRPHPSQRRQGPRARFSYELTPDGILVIEDEGAGRTVSNDIDQVLLDIAELEGPHAGRRVLYRDSGGEWTGVPLTAEGRPNGFFYVGGTTEAEALTLFRQKNGA